jgi:hypothetical protein
VRTAPTCSLGHHFLHQPEHKMSIGMLFIHIYSAKLLSVNIPFIGGIQIRSGPKHGTIGWPRRTFLAVSFDFLIFDLEYF